MEYRKYMVEYMDIQGNISMMGINMWKILVIFFTQATFVTEFFSIIFVPVHQIFSTNFFPDHNLIFPYSTFV